MFDHSFPNHVISIGAGKNMDASWLQGRLNHFQRHSSTSGLASPYASSNNSLSSFSSGFSSPNYTAAVRSSDCSPMDEGDMARRVADQNFPPNLNGHLCSKRGRGEECGDLEEDRERHRLKLMNQNFHPNIESGEYANGCFSHFSSPMEM